MTRFGSKQTHYRTFAIAVPMILSNLTVPITGLVDTAVIGHLDHAYYLAAVAIASLIVTMLVWSMGFLRMSTTGLAAQAFGQESYAQLQKVLFNATLLALVASLLMILLHPYIWRVSVYFIKASAEALHYGEIYFDIRIWSMPALLFKYVIVGWLLGLQRAMPTLIMLLIGNVINIALNIWFVVFLEWGVSGAAWASVIAEYAALFYGLAIIYFVLRKQPSHNKVWFDPIEIKRVLKLNADIFIRTLALESVFYIQTAIGASLGDKILAANAILNNFLMMMSYGLDGFANAVETMAGKAYGKKDKEQFFESIKVTGVWSFFASVVIALSYWVFGDYIISLLTDIEALTVIANEFLPYLIWLPIVASWSYWLDGIFIGITHTKDMRNSMVFAVVLIFLPLTSLVWWLGNHGLWLAFYGFMIGRAALLGYRLKNASRFFT